MPLSKINQENKLLHVQRNEHQNQLLLENVHFQQQRTHLHHLSRSQLQVPVHALRHYDLEILNDSLLHYPHRSYLWNNTGISEAVEYQTFIRNKFSYTMMLPHRDYYGSIFDSVPGGKLYFIS
jgi:hypothetical protein